MLILFKDDEKFNIEDMVDEFVTFFIAGTNTYLIIYNLL